MFLFARIMAAYGLMVFVGALWRALPFDVVAPQLPVLFAAYAGLTSRERISSAMASAAVIGYLGDLLSGSPRGLMALVCGILCLTTRLSSARLLVRGFGYVLVFAFGTALGAGLLTIGIRVYLGAGLGPLWHETLVLLGSSVLTAVLAPLVFRICRGLDARFARTHRERDALREGYLT